ncbi:MAG: methyl-accepting chemotaxis protein [Myxococcales bacterium]|nr:methyl-accepting chemotaxis protein [Myxococcales bacterium]
MATPSSSGGSPTLSAMTAVTPRAMLWIGVLDLSITVVVLLLWLTVLEVDALAALLLTAVRVGLWVWPLLRMLGPVRAWEQSSGRRGDDHLLIADAAFHQLPRRFLLRYAGGWLAIQLVAVLFLARVDMGATQLVAALLGAIAIVLSLPALLLPLLNHATFPIHATLSTRLLQRDLDPPRPRTPLAQVLLLVFLSLCSGAIVGLGSMAAWVRADSREQQSMAEQRHRAEREALRVSAGLGLDDDTQLLDPTQLPQQPVDARREQAPTAADQPRTILDREHDRILAIAPVGDGRWVLVSADYDQQLWQTLLGLFLTTLLGLTPGVLAGLAVSTVITGPLRRIDDATRQLIETGRLRGQARVMTISNDEVGDLAHNFNRMLDVFEELAFAAHHVAEGDLAVTLDRSGDLQDAFRAMIGRLAETVEQIRSTALEVAAASAQIQASIQEQEQASEQQAQSLREVGDAVANLAQSAEAITAAAAGVLVDAEQTRSNTDVTVARITELGTQAAGIGILLGLIAEIAERSDLLALNGSLEAVRAGEAGRGFALVAAEMRRLAERVTGTVADVETQVRAIQSASASSEAATVESRNLAQNTAQAARKISRETEQQGMSTDQLAITVHQVVEIAAATSMAISQTRATTEGLRAHAEYLEQLTKDFRLPTD